MVATILPKFKEEWEDPQFEATKYLAVIFEFWLRKGIFLEQKPNIQSIAVKFRCGHTQLQKYLRGYHKPPRIQQPKVQQTERQRVMLFGRCRHQEYSSQEEVEDQESKVI